MSNIRPRRGYEFEKHVVESLNATGWKARRLGSPSIELPDVLAINNRTNTVCAIECKSGISTSLVVPADQIARCMEMVDDLRAYKNRLTVLSFKFVGRNRNRGLRYTSLLWNDSVPADTRCSYDGTVRVGGRITKLEEVDFI